MYVIFEELFDDKKNLKEEQFINLATFALEVYQQKDKYIQFIISRKINELWHFFQDNLFYGMDIEDKATGWKIINDMGYYEWTSKPSWKDFKSFLGNVIYEYRIFKNKYLVLKPLHYKEWSSINKENILSD